MAKRRICLASPPEYLTMKYDTLQPAERKVLHQMDVSWEQKRRWKSNDFRNIPAFQNDGKKISETLNSLFAKGFIVKDDKGNWKLSQ